MKAPVNKQLTLYGNDLISLLLCFVKYNQINGFQSKIA